jgi:hypothetical protein
VSNEVWTLRLAVLIDADNVSHKLADKLFSEVAKLGEATVRRVYGDFGGPAKGWKDAIGRHAIVPHQQFANVPNKNATDFALVIDAMDLLHTDRLDGFCLVSSDSDYTRLATRMRDHGLNVFVFGNKATPDSFRQASHKFIEIDIPLPGVGVSATKPAKASTAGPKATKASTEAGSVTDARNLLLQAFEQLDAAEWVPLAELLQVVRSIKPGFSAKAYGTSKPITLVRKTQMFDDELKGGTMMVRRKPQSGFLSLGVRAA